MIKSISCPNPNCNGTVFPVLDNPINHEYRCKACGEQWTISNWFEDIPLNRPTGPAEDDVRDKKLQAQEEVTGFKVDLVKVYDRMKKWLGKA